MIESESFKLTRYFSIASAIGTLILLLVVSVILSKQSHQELVELKSKSNADISTMLGKVIWPRYIDYGQRSLRIDRKDLANQPEIYAIRNEIIPFLRNSDIHKVKIYNVAGTVIFSTEDKQIGDDHRVNPGFRSALGGAVKSSFTYRGEFYSFEEIIFDRSMISSYVPIADSDSGQIVAVFEVYSDVSDLIDEISDAGWELVSIVFACLLGLYIFLFRIIQRAEGIIATQEQERKTFLNKIHQMAYFDTLTELANRANFDEKLDQAIARAKRTEKHFGVMYFDLDGFKKVNDTLGHEAGDQVLMDVAKRFQRAVRESDLVFRIGGDEFTGIFENIDNIGQLELLAEKIVSALDEPVRYKEHDILTSASIGIAIYPDSGGDPGTILNTADQAMYRAKQKGKNCYSK